MPLQPVDAALGLRTDIHRDTDTVEGPLVGLGQEETGEIEGFLHTHATMREGAALALEGASVVGIVEVDGEVVGKAEHDAPQGVACPTLLTYTQTACAQLGGCDIPGSEGVA